MISFVVAVAQNGVIGRDNGLPWRLSSDLKRFKAVTMGKPIIMGRKTWDTLGKPLPGRTNIVITRDPAFAVDGVIAVRSVDEALMIAGSHAAADKVDEICVIGSSWTGRTVFTSPGFWPISRATRFSLPSIRRTGTKCFRKNSRRVKKTIIRPATRFTNDARICRLSGNQYENFVISGHNRSTFCQISMKTRAAR